MEILFAWCRRWNLPPKPEEVVDPTNARYAEAWVLAAIGKTLSKWAPAPPKDPGKSGFEALRHGAVHPILPIPPVDGVRRWWPTLEPWDVEDPVTFERVGYFHEARRESGLSFRAARHLFLPYKAESEAVLERFGYRRVPQKRAARRPSHTPSTHYEWFVRYQILRERQVDVALTGVSLRKVQSALRGVAETLPLLRRSSSRGATR